MNRLIEENPRLGRYLDSHRESIETSLEYNFTVPARLLVQNVASVQGRITPAQVASAYVLYFEGLGFRNVSGASRFEDMVDITLEGDGRKLFIHATDVPSQGIKVSSYRHDLR